MNTKELIEIADSLGLEHYNECENYICIKGINGHATVCYTDLYLVRWPSMQSTSAATMMTFVNHLKQMGRDSLKEDLNTLLSTTRYD